MVWRVYENKLNEVKRSLDTFVVFVERVVDVLLGAAFGCSASILLRFASLLDLRNPLCSRFVASGMRFRSL